MAVLFSETQLNYARKKFYGKFYTIKDNLKDLNFLQKLVNKTLIFLYLTKYTLVNFKRKIYRFINILFNKKSGKKIINFSLNLDEQSTQKASKDLKLNNFTFIENFLSQESYQYLINNWPNINYFNHNKKIIKHYNSIINWQAKNNYNKINGALRLKIFYKFLLSEEFKKFFDNLMEFKKKNYQITSISSSMATKGSFLIPHIDGVYKNKKEIEDYNFIYFLDGHDENPSLGGGTGFYKDNEFKSPIFIPHTIKNSLVIYNQSEEFYHGFKMIECPKNIYRKTVNFRIATTDNL